MELSDYPYVTIFNKVWPREDFDTPEHIRDERKRIVLDDLSNFRSRREHFRSLPSHLRLILFEIYYQTAPHHENIPMVFHLSPVTREFAEFQIKTTSNLAPALMRRCPPHPELIVYMATTPKHILVRFLRIVPTDTLEQMRKYRQWQPYLPLIDGLIACHHVQALHIP